MKSLHQIRQNLLEAITPDMEAHFVAATNAQKSVGPNRFDEAPAQGIQVGTELSVNGKWCIVDHIDGDDVLCSDEDGKEMQVNLKKMANVHVIMDPKQSKIRKLRGQANESESGAVKQTPMEPAAVTEELDAEKDPVEKWIADYSASQHERFKGKSKSDRIKMALADFYATNKASGKKMAECMDGGHQAEEVSMTRLELDEIADMADDLFNVLPNFDECPAWVQHKIAGMHASLHGIYDYYRQKGMERDRSAQCSSPDAIQIALPSSTNPITPILPVPPASMRESSLIENKKQAELYVSQGKLTSDDFNKLLNADPTKQKKYVGWMAKQWIAMGDKLGIDDLRNTIEEYDVFVNKGKAKTKDVNAFKTFEDLAAEVKELNDTGAGLSNAELENDYEVIADDVDKLIMCPHTHEASRKLGLTTFAYRDCGDGKDSAWCTTYKTSDHWNDYYLKNGATFYYIKIKSDHLMDKLEKAFPNKGKHMRVVAIAVLPNGRLDAYDGLDVRFDEGTSQSNVEKFRKIIGI